MYNITHPQNGGDYKNYKITYNLREVDNVEKIRRKAPAFCSKNLLDVHNFIMHFRINFVFEWYH
jgi:hypothetical protein